MNPGIYEGSEEREAGREMKKHGSSS